MSVWNEASRRLRESTQYVELLGGARRVERLPAAASAWVCALLSEDHGRPVIALVPHEADALAWMEMSRLIAGDDSGVYFPAPALTP